jgi:uncharacterized lipoprotein YddW (UPF0748 family)
MSALCALIFALSAAPEAQAQPPEPAPKHEFRAAWIATVANLDWPRSKDGRTPVQKHYLRQMLDRLKAAGINAAFFQVRTEADALYESDIEPWSYWLTGKQGRAPDPFYDPLRFAIREAHKRGMELHAWLNPYRADRGNSYQPASGHVSQEHPEWLLTFGDKEILDPGLPQVRDYVTRVVMDVVRRYDIDGVHFDDYFYPYPPNEIRGTDKDDATFAEHARGFDNIHDWRRDNINLLIEQMHDSIQMAKPDVDFGVSPFGIWKNGVPSGISGLNAYRTIYADALAWLDEQSIDYLTPQLYWKFGGGQDYGTLAPWWAGQVEDADRHLYPGLGVYKADDATIGRVQYSANVVPRQVRFNRERDDIQGSVFFRAENITRFSSHGITDTLKTHYYRRPALSPTMAWQDTTAPGPPSGLDYEWTGDNDATVRLAWSAPDSTAEQAAPRRFAVYRVRADDAPDPAAAMQQADNLLAVMGQTNYEDKPVQADEPYHYFVTAASRNAVESVPTATVQAEGRRVDVAEGPDAPAPFELKNAAPNPFREATTIRFRLERPARVTLAVYDALGRRVRLPAERRRYDSGSHGVRFEARGLPAGTYFAVLEAAGRRDTRAMTLVR